MTRPVVVLAFLLVIVSGRALAVEPNAIVATINPTPYSVLFLIDGHPVSMTPGVQTTQPSPWPMLWRITPGQWHTLTVVTHAGFANGKTYDVRVIARCTVRIRPKAGDDYIVLPSTPADKGECPLRKFDHTHTGDLND